MNKTKGIASDIDDTISWTIKKIFQAMQIRWGNPEQLTVEEMIAKYHYSSNPPYYQTSEIKQWVTDYVNTNEFQLDIPLIPEADIYLNKIHNEIIPLKRYITLRSQETIPGTQYWLSHNNFPHAEIIASPHKTAFGDGNQWKANQLKLNSDRIVGIVDDNAYLIPYLENDYDGTIFLFGHDKKPETSLNVIPCPDWSTVYREMQKLYSSK